MSYREGRPHGRPPKYEKEGTMMKLAAVGRPIDQHRKKWRLGMLGSVAPIGFIPVAIDPFD